DATTEDMLSSTEEMLSSPTFLSNLATFLKPPHVLLQVLANDPPTTTPDVDEALELLPDFPCSLQDPFPKGALQVDVHSLPLSLQLEHPTLQLLRNRMKRGSKPGKRRDGCKLGLVVEGGGMRGVVSGGMLMAVHDLGMRDAFDAVYGSSAGAINATYFLTGQPYGLDVYADDISNKTFLDFKRIIGPDPVMNLDFLIDYVMNEVKPMDFEKVIDSPIPLKVVASSLDTLQPILLQSFSTPQELAEALKASATVPEIAGSPRVIQGERLVDAAVFEPIPYRAAIKDGCTHVLALCSKPPSVQSPVQKVVRKVVDIAVNRIINNPPYMKAASQVWLEEMKTNGGLTQEELMLISMFQGLKGGSPSAAGGQILPIYPPPRHFLSPTCTVPSKLRMGAEAGRLSACRVLEPLASGPTGLFPFLSSRVLEPLASGPTGLLPFLSSRWNI
ncbi:unnamed protein product, partial [Ostreobium quekettii]